jgi:hypothetical protein
MDDLGELVPFAYGGAVHRQDAIAAADAGLLRHLVRQDLPDAGGHQRA